MAARRPQSGVRPMSRQQPLRGRPNPGPAAPSCPPGAPERNAARPEPRGSVRRICWHPRPLRSGVCAAQMHAQWVQAPVGGAPGCSAHLPPNRNNSTALLPRAAAPRCCLVVSPCQSVWRGWGGPGPCACGPPQPRLYNNMYFLVLLSAPFDGGAVASSASEVMRVVMGNTRGDKAPCQPKRQPTLNNLGLKPRQHTADSSAGSDGTVGRAYAIP